MNDFGGLTVANAVYLELPAEEWGQLEIWHKALEDIPHTALLLLDPDGLSPLYSFDDPMIEGYTDFESQVQLKEIDEHGHLYTFCFLKNNKASLISNCICHLVDDMSLETCPARKASLDFQGTWQEVYNSISEMQNWPSQTVLGKPF